METHFDYSAYRVCIPLPELTLLWSPVLGELCSHSNTCSHCTVRAPRTHFVRVNALHHAPSIPPHRKSKYAPGNRIEASPVPGGACDGAVKGGSTSPSEEGARSLAGSNPSSMHASTTGSRESDDGEDLTKFVQTKYLYLADEYLGFI